MKILLKNNIYIYIMGPIYIYIYIYIHIYIYTHILLNTLQNETKTEIY